MCTHARPTPSPKLWSEQVRVQILARPPTRSVTLGEYLGLSEPQFPFLNLISQISWEDYMGWRLQSVAQGQAPHLDILTEVLP